MGFLPIPHENHEIIKLISPSNIIYAFIYLNGSLPTQKFYFKHIMPACSFADFRSLTYIPIVGELFRLVEAGIFESSFIVVRSIRIGQATLIVLFSAVCL